MSDTPLVDKILAEIEERERCTCPHCGYVVDPRDVTLCVPSESGVHIVDMECESCGDPFRATVMITFDCETERLPGGHGP